MKRVLAGLVIVCILAIVGYVAGFYILTPSPKEVLERVGRTYATAQDMTSRSSCTMSYNMLGMDMSLKGQSDVQYQRPGKTRAKLNWGGLYGEQEYVSDGETMYMRMSMLGGLLGAPQRWIKMEVPEGARGTGAPSGTSPYGEMGPFSGMGPYGSGVHPNTLLEGADPLAGVKSMALDAGKPWRPAKVYTLDVTYTDGGTQRLRIDRQTWTIRELEWEAGLGTTPGSVEGAAKDDATEKGPQEVAGLLSQMVEGMDLRYSETFEETKLNAGIDESVFVVDAEEEDIIDGSDWEKMMQASGEMTPEQLEEMSEKWKEMMGLDEEAMQQWEAEMEKALGSAPGGT